MKQLNDFQKFLDTEMQKREMSMRQFAEFIDVAATTVTRMMDQAEPKKPGLDVLIKISKATHVSLPALVAMAYPDVSEATKLSASAQVLAQQIEELPDRTKEIVLALIRDTQS